MARQPQWKAHLCKPTHVAAARAFFALKDRDKAIRLLEILPNFVKLLLASVVEQVHAKGFGQRHFGLFTGF